MPINRVNNQVFDARPDRIDYRDRPYNPPLVSLPEQWPDQRSIEIYLPNYTKTHDLILDQGQEGSCTGFGLAAMINYLLWRQYLEADASGAAVKPKKLVTVSPRMLYQMARVYDEWPGEDYDGSSCRGAMKGWHRHGVCSKELWPYNPKRFIKPKDGWQQDAARRPLGAYYRVNKDSISDMQAAIYEVGAIYASAAVHEGWFLKSYKKLPVIPSIAGQTGGHAFAITGYTPQGFIIQNSWGPEWGYYGFAVLPYEDWIQHGTDVWVAVLGAPMQVRSAGRTMSSKNLSEVAAGKAEWFWRSDKVTKEFSYQNSAVEPASESKAYEHTAVLGNNGLPLNRFLDLEDSGDAVKEVIYNLPHAWLKAQANPKIAIYAHGGLNDEEASIKRVRLMAPYFIENEIYPLFITWRTGFKESLEGMIEDSTSRFFMPEEGEAAMGKIADLKRRLKDAKDRSIELACKELLVKPIWTEMKQNAASGADPGAGLTLIAGHISNLKKAFPKLEVHLVGHSAGSILHGHLLKRLMARKIDIKTLSLFAPACTVDFALNYYVPAIEKKAISWDAMHFDILSDERERADTVGPYGKSLLYLVSRALEDVHKMPLLGMHAAWDKTVEAQNMWHDRTVADVEKWRKLTAKFRNLTIHGKEREKVSDGQVLIPLAHGSFDNDVAVISTTLERIRGAKLRAKVENLRGF